MIFHPELKVYGNLSFRDKNCPTEANEQITFFSQLRAKYPELGAIAVHVKNEGKKTNLQVSIDNALGQVKGASDVIIPGCPAFVCEIKRTDHTLSKWQSGQQEYLLNCQKQGAFVCVALGYAAALEAVLDWLQKTKAA